MAKHGHRFLVTVQPLDETGLAVGSTLTFEHINHDDIVAVARRVRDRSGLPAEDAAATAIGIKLLGKAMLSARADDLFDPIRGPLLSVVQALKRRVAGGLGADGSVGSGSIDP